MDSIFGIGIAELFFIAILALIILGPERLPGAIREVVKVIRYVRNLTNELTSQFGDEMKAFDDLNPQKILNEMIADEDKKEKAVAKAKPTTTKPATTKSTTTKSTPAKPAAAKPAAKPATAKTSEEKALEDKASEDKPAAGEPVAEQTAAAKVATDQPAPDEPAAEKPVGDLTEDTAKAEKPAPAAAAASETPKRIAQPTIKGPLLPGGQTAGAQGGDRANEAEATAKAANAPSEPSILPPDAASSTAKADHKAQANETPAQETPKGKKVVEKPAQPSTVAVNGASGNSTASNGRAASTDGGEA